jgi:hypothetical protein
MDEDKSALYFFEQKNLRLQKIDAIRISLCLSLKILNKLCELKKKQACILIVENAYSGDLFRYMMPFLVYDDNKTLSYVMKMVSIIQQCTEF